MRIELRLEITSETRGRGCGRSTERRERRSNGSEYQRRSTAVVSEISNGLFTYRFMIRNCKFVFLFRACKDVCSVCISYLNKSPSTSALRAGPRARDVCRTIVLRTAPSHQSSRETDDHPYHLLFHRQLFIISCLFPSSQATTQD